MEKQDFQDHEIWELKNSISYFVEPRLKLYIERVKSGELMSIPNWVLDNEKDIDKVSVEKLNEIWAGILENMLFPFDYQVNPDHFNNLSNEEVMKRKRDGLDLFAKYFEHLWD